MKTTQVLRLQLLCLTLTLGCVLDVSLSAASVFKGPWIELPDSIEVGRVDLGTSVLRSFPVSNNSSSAALLYPPQYIGSTSYFAMEVSTNITSQTIIEAGHSVQIEITIKARHNVDLRGWLRMRMLVGCTELSKDILLYGSGTSTDYLTTYNLEYSALYDSLHAMVVNHTSLGYKPARQMMFGKADNVNDSVECIYTGKKIYTVGIPPNGEFNTEHTWVQSRGSSVDPMQSDVNHLYPTNPNANSMRANFPFGTIVKVWKDAGGGSRLGFTAKGDTVFEPRTVSKGNIARSIFYYLLRYGNLTGYYTSPYSMDHDLRIWNQMDPPDEREHARCDTIARYQAKRNPLVDHPEFVERLDFIGDAQKNTTHFLSSSMVCDFSLDTAEWTASLVNQSSQTRRISTLSIDQPQLQLVADDTVEALAPHSLRTLRFRYTRSSTPPSTFVLRVSMDNQDESTAFISNCATVGIEQQQSAATLHLNPHPLQHSTTVHFGTPITTVQHLHLYSLHGVVLCDLASRIEHGSVESTLLLRREDAQGEHLALLHGLIDGRLISRVVVIE